jgi:hypothetical protein
MAPVNPFVSIRTVRKYVNDKNGMIDALIDALQELPVLQQILFITFADADIPNG